VFTLGLGADRGHILAGPGIPSHDVPVVQTDRGGEVTFHGPGQVVIYLLMDLRRNKPGGKLYARQFVHKIEQAIINVLAAYNLAGERIEGAPGIYIAGGPSKGAKIAALGLKVRGNGCTYHGVSLNVAMDLAPFTWINPCGYSGLATVDMRSMGVEATMGAVQQALASALVQQLAVQEPNNTTGPQGQD
jgi:lipoyl(octanoyl) transferase